MSEFNYTGNDVLDVMSLYAKNRNKLIENFITKYFKINQDSTLKLLEFGAGTGEFINRFKKYSKINTYTVELDENYYKKLAENHNSFKNINDLSTNVDAVFSIDVMEHIENDVDALKDIYNKLESKGHLLIYVPARPELYSNFDKSIGHFRRYKKKELVNKVKEAGFTVKYCRYQDFLGYFAAYYNVMFSKNDATLNKKAVAVYDKFIVPTSNVVEKIMVKPFIGKNIILLATKP